MKRVLLLSVLICGLLAAPAHATDFVVNSTADPVSPDLACTPEPGGCTLRDALDDAGPADRVIVPANSYNLTQGPLTPSGDVIVGAGARTTIINAGGTGKAIEAVNTSGNQVSGVTLRNGGGQSQTSGAGGAVLVAGSFAPASLILRNVTVIGNRSTAGGGVASLSGTLTIENSTIVGNLARTGVGASGGGVIVSGGTTTIRNSTISGNTAQDTDGVDASGGGVAVESGTLVAQNVTIAGNTANIGTGIWTNGPGGNPSVTINSTLVADTCSFGVPLTGGTHNLSSSATCFGTAVNPLLGGLANNGGPTDTRALLAGSPAINGGAGCPTLDQRGVAREGVCDIGAYEYRTPAPPPDQGLPDPVPHKNVNALPKSGTVKVKLPGTKKFVLLDEDAQIPLGTTVDVRRGRVTIVAAAGAGQTADFYAGIFKLTQTKGAKPTTVLTLVEKLSCSKKKASAAAKKTRKRRLWGNGKGRFRTKGKRSAATVVGTWWLVEDRCDRTITRVKRGKVRVRDFLRHKTVIVKAGHKYVARARRR